MDSNLRKRFMSPFSISKTTERSQHHPIASSPQQGQWSVPSLTPKSTSNARSFKSKSLLCSDSSQERGSRSSDQTAERVSERGPRQKVCRSLFTLKPAGCEPKSYLERQSHLNKQTHSEKEQVFETDSFTRNDFLRTNDEKSSISLVEELIGQHKKVDVQRIFDISDLIKPEAVDKFRSAITPTKAHMLRFSNLSDSSTYCMISNFDAMDSFTQASRLIRLPENNEKFVQMPTLADSTSSGLSISKGSLIKEQSNAAKSKEHSLQAASFCESMFSDMSTGKRRMIRGVSIPRCGRLTNQSYQEQAKEFQEILSSKVRQVAEVADCLQHTELLYTILGI